jgi:hypothetical protein
MIQSGERLDLPPLRTHENPLGLDRPVLEHADQ